MWSCDTSREVEKPKNFIGEDRLVKILADAAIHSAAKSQDRRMLEAKNVDIVVFLKKISTINFTISISPIFFDFL